MLTHYVIQKYHITSHYHVFSQDRLEKVAIRRDFLQKNGESKAAKMQRSVDLLKRQLVEREDESTLLERQIRDLKLEVAAAKNVRDSNNEARGILSDDPTNDAVLKMKKIMARRHLLDSARAQAEEADFLRQELDRLRQVNVVKLEISYLTASLS
jgi:hypothetical protein